MGRHQARKLKSSKHAARVRVSGPDDLLAIVPFWLGYRPENCVVVMVEAQGLIRSGCAIALDQCHDTELLGSALGLLCERTGADSFLLVAYGNPRCAVPALEQVRRELTAQTVVESIVVHDGRYWASSRADDPQSSPGRVLDCDASPVTVAAVEAGLQVLGSRADVAAMLAGPDESDDEAAFWWAEAQENTAGWDLSRCIQLVDECLAEAVGALHQPDTQRCAQLGAVVQRIAVRDHAWLAMSLEDGWRHQQLWLWVVAVTPEPYAAPALCLSGIASWLSGGGALLTECVNRCERLHPDYSMLTILRELHDGAVPPSVWRRWSASMAGIGTTGADGPAPPQR
ncbi:protein of unknown function [Propionibacterium cyclohexanicum]|uniref:DUF4192 domain-containing protein n=1 Tax=Propionibacterium cyclohexanicum TaxID=64702 RepID=A0A1H9SSD1_9ACTN|nr:DUF4192 domain-containing protein [Propionibacterium cyclohexanicum]SER87876.1 protein of unknown function [Propionibacterium cyclohexanicum]